MRATKPAVERAAGERGLWRLSALGRTLVVATLLAASLMVAFSFARTPATTPACACGLGNTVTMVANNAPALAYAPPNVATDAPAGIFALDYFINKPVTFYEDLSRAPSAPDPNSVKWRWDFGDGSSMSYQVKPTHTYATPGTYTVVVSVYEPVSGQWGVFDNAIMKVIAAPYANPPVAKARAVTSSVIGVGDKISFDATGSHAADGSNATYQWNFGDNSVATGLEVTHQFNQAGRGFITLTVTDARGAKAIAQVSVVIVESNPNQPAKVTVAPTTGTVGAQFLFDASQTQPPADQPVAVAWDFGDGSPLVTTSQPNVGHIYHQPGNYTVSVGVYGQLGDGSVATIKAQVGPAAAVGPAAGKGGPNWPLLAGVALVVMLALAGLTIWLTQRKRAAAERQRRAQIELARARRANSVNGGRGGGNGQRRPPNGPSGAGGGPRAGAPTGAQGRPTTRQPYPPRRDDSQNW